MNDRLWRTPPWLKVRKQKIKGVTDVQYNTWNYSKVHRPYYGL
jgi:hypothetical protein